MAEQLAFGQPVERLTEIAARHSIDLEAAEALALGAVAQDRSIDPALFVAFVRWRAVGALLAACRNDGDVFQATLLEAARLNRVGVL